MTHEYKPTHNSHSNGFKHAVDVEHTLEQVRAPQRDGFRQELRAQVLTAAAHKEEPMKKNVWKWLIASPIVAGAALAVVFGVQLAGQNQNTGPLQKLSAQEVFANSIENLFAEVQEDEVRYQRLRTITELAPGETSEMTTEAWKSGLNYRVDLKSSDNQLIDDSHMMVIAEDGSVLNCFGTNDGENVLRLFDGPTVEEREATNAFCDSYEQYTEFFNLGDADHTIIPVVSTGSDNFLTIQWEGSEALTTVDVNEYIDSPALESIYRMSTGIYNVQQIATDNGYENTITIPGVAGVDPEMQDTVRAVQFQLKDGQGYTQVYAYNVATEAVTVVPQAELQTQYETLTAEQVAEVLHGEDYSQPDWLMNYFLTQARETGELLSEETVEYNGQDALRLEYNIPEQERMDELNVTFTVLTDAQQLVELAYAEDGNEMRMVIEENTILTDTTGSEFFTEEYWRNTLPQ